MKKQKRCPNCGKRNFKTEWRPYGDPPVVRQQDGHPPRFQRYTTCCYRPIGRVYTGYDPPGGRTPSQVPDSCVGSLRTESLCPPGLWRRAMLTDQPLPHLQARPRFGNGFGLLWKGEHLRIHGLIPV